MRRRERDAPRHDGRRRGNIRRLAVQAAEGARQGIAVASGGRAVASGGRAPWRAVDAPWRAAVASNAPWRTRPLGPMHASSMAHRPCMHRQCMHRQCMHRPWHTGHGTDPDGDRERSRL
jgi:hypothetical protein